MITKILAKALAFAIIISLAFWIKSLMGFENTVILILASIYWAIPAQK